MALVAKVTLQEGKRAAFFRVGKLIQGARVWLERATGAVLVGLDARLACERP